MKIPLKSISTLLLLCFAGTSVHASSHSTFSGPNPDTQEPKPVRGEYEPLGLSELKQGHAYTEWERMQLYKYWGLASKKSVDLTPYVEWTLGSNFADKAYTRDEFLEGTELGRWAMQMDPSLVNWGGPYTPRHILGYLSGLFGPNFAQQMAQSRLYGLAARQHAGYLRQNDQQLERMKFNNAMRLSRYYWTNLFKAGRNVSKWLLAAETQKSAAKFIILLTALYAGYKVVMKAASYVFTPTPVIVKEQRLSSRWLGRSKKQTSHLDELHYTPEVTAWLKEAVAEDKQRILANGQYPGKYKFSSLLLYGPPGTGKTALAHAYAAEADFDFVHIGGSSWAQLNVEEGLQNFKATLRMMAKTPGPCSVSSTKSTRFLKSGGPKSPLPWTKS